MATPQDAASPTRSRRQFLADAGTAVGLTIVAPGVVRGSQANSKIRLGIIGCGGRGSFMADLFQKHGGYEIAALSDYFPDRVASVGDKFGVPAAGRFSGLSGYKRLLALPLDAVAVQTPPYFHPAQVAETVEAGRHVYIAKPVAVDVPGCRSIEASAKAAQAKKLTMLVDFQTRANEFYVEAVRRVHAGAIGTIAFGESTYHAEDPFEAQYEHVRGGTPEGILRGWGLSRELSGDIITEQNIHTLDVASWLLRTTPLRAYGTGGRKYRTVGTCWDTFSVTFHYPDDVGITFSSRQFKGHGTRPEGIRTRLFGTDGVIETEYGGQVLIRGKQFYRGGETPTIYRDGAAANVAAFHAAIQKGDTSNTTVPESVRSNLLTILGRTAAYKGEVVTWEALLRSDERLEPNLSGLKD